MATYTQSKRSMKVDTALGADVLLLDGFAGDEGVSTPFFYTLDLLSEDASIDAKKLLRSAVVVTLELADGGPRIIHGLIRRFVQLGRSEDKLTTYRAEVVPWLWCLSLSSECKIFQDLSVLDIIEKVFKAQGYNDFQIKCTKSYPKREYCVQYRETHLNFVSRLMEEEGIFYFFEHSKDKHVLTLADANSAVKPCPGQATARMAMQADAWQEADVVTVFEREHAVQSDKVTLRDYDYLQPSLQLENSGAGEADAPHYHNSFVAMPHGVPFHPPRTSPKPLVWGSQSALVVGKSGEEIWVDKHGRVKVQFHWDRNGKKDESSSCWVRVSSAWSGKNWGVVHIPRIGQEVIVDFLEGDPDRPIITGRVYNADQTPPYALPGDQTQSGIKSRSSKAGGTDNFNEIRFEDKKGSEVLFIHAEKDEQVEVENDRSDSVGHDETVSIGNDRTESVKNNESITIDKNRTESVGGDESVSISGNRSLTVSKDETIDVTGNRSDSVAKSENVSIADNRSHSVGKDDELSVGKNLTITAGDNIMLTSGDASITLKKNGDIKIEGKNITIQGSGKIAVKADSDV